MTQKKFSRHAAKLVAAAGILALAQACSSGTHLPPDPGPMGSTATGGQADLPDRNSQSTPVQKPN